jgi:LPXTG-motif cell wall-anchored protein
LKHILKYSFLGMALALAVGSTNAHADDWDHDHRDHDPKPHTAPEVDPSLAFGGLALLGGTLTVLRSRRSK